jgi:hypothetical protein
MDKLLLSSVTELLLDMLYSTLFLYTLANYTRDVSKLDVYA